VNIIQTHKKMNYITPKEVYYYYYYYCN